MEGIKYFIIGLIIGLIPFLVLMYQYPHAEPFTESEQDLSTKYMDLLFSVDDSFTDAGLGYILGPHRGDEYTVDGNPIVQEELDKLLKGYFNQTFNLYKDICEEMDDPDNRTEKMYTVLFNILYRQKTYIDKYASDRFKGEVDLDIFWEEENLLTKVTDTTDYSQYRILKYMKEMRN